MTLPAGLGDANTIALFLDFDGTLVEIEDRPDAVRASDATRAAIADLHRATHGALAIVTGRDIEDIDVLLAPLRLPVAGVHGLTRRSAAGDVISAMLDEHLVLEAQRLLAPLLAREPGLVLERKTAALALHYRLAANFESEAIAFMERVVDLDPALRLTRNKMVIEVRPGGADKGSAVASFLNEAPFAGRIPVFVGDDVTDEDGFAAVNARGGVSIKIGAGATAARWRAASTAEFLAWLHEAARAAAALTPRAKVSSSVRRGELDTEATSSADVAQRTRR